MPSAKLLNHICPVCSSKEGYMLGELKYTLFDNSPINNTFDVKCCNKCGFILCDTSSTQENYNEFYKESFYSNDYINRIPTKDDIHYVNETLDILSPHLKSKDLSIFDIGCGRGHLLEKLHKYGYKNLYGVDPSQSCIESLRNNTNLNSQTGNTFNIPFTNIKADIIILSHVIEHIIDLQEALKNIRNKLTNNGIVYVEVPNAINYDLFTTHPLRYFYLQHVIHFDDFHLNNLFIQNSFIELKRGHRVRKEGRLLMNSIWGIYRKEEEMITPRLNPSFNLSQKVKNWFDNISLDNDNILTNLVQSKSSTYIWGLGTHAQLMLSMSPLKNCNMIYYIDNDERNRKKTINNKKIYSTNMLYKASKEDTVVICAPTHTYEMYKFLMNEIQFRGKVIIIDFNTIKQYE